MRTARSKHRASGTATAMATAPIAGMMYAGSFDDDRLKNTKIATAEHHAKRARVHAVRRFGASGSAAAASIDATIAGSHGMRKRDRDRE